jgi:hypothetical protein
MNRRQWLYGFCLVGFSFSVAGSAAAQTPPTSKRNDDKPFAEHFLALQLSDSDPKKQRLVLSVANNILKAYGPDKIAIEVVTFGPGIDLLRDNSENRQSVDSLVSQGVRFDVCGNTLDTIERETGKRPTINPHAIEVEVGVGQLLNLSERGYKLVRP